jgi:hypothetical protein
VRWTAAVAQLEKDLGNLVGNMLIASGCIAYLGPFTAPFRVEMTAGWVKLCVGLGIPVDPKFDLLRLLSDPTVVRDWMIQGLPSDAFSAAGFTVLAFGRGCSRTLNRGASNGVPAANAHGHENGEEGVGAGRGADGVAAAGVIAHRGFKFIHRRAEDEMLVLEQGIKATVHVVFHLPVLQAQIQQGNRHGKKISGSRRTRRGDWLPKPPHRRRNRPAFPRRN